MRRFKEVVVPLTLEAEREYGRELKRQSAVAGKKIDKEVFEKFKAEIGPKVKYFYICHERENHNRLP